MGRLWRTAKTGHGSQLAIHDNRPALAKLRRLEYDTQLVHTDLLEPHFIIADLQGVRNCASGGEPWHYEPLAFAAREAETYCLLVS